MLIPECVLAVLVHHVRKLTGTTGREEFHGGVAQEQLSEPHPLADRALQIWAKGIGDQRPNAMTTYRVTLDKTTVATARRGVEYVASSM